MSEVKRFDHVNHAHIDDCEHVESSEGAWVTASDYDALAAEAQALREEVEKAQNALAFTEQWHGVRYERLWHWAHAELDEEQKRRYFNIVANGTAEHSEPPTYAQQLCRMKHRYECAEKEAAALRARVAVVPDRLPRSSDIASIHQHSIGWNACLDELARLNGLTVSEGLLRKWLELMEHGDYREGHCMCGSSVDGHGIGDGHAPVDAGEYYAGQVMEELRALLSEQA
ncbi:hypothetical protein [Pseudomonas aeruginosa]|uniref:hypothetical protein n=1 Tax=Pseudomonas aeruginosa TaxID=287 RepID=UPI000EB1BF93|nr:hypothetical protein [Pseudomonas aeruginosa]ELV5910869.1 hypothetical protein [Pseudomonas aeruginosa]MCT0643863.1 hypothetical protein [Pseudomonas aeruginosa]MCT1198058.1 hypothetical protein [Pseudomonas aeruginosa]MCT1301592.1 hypothetical protein [Pseudomonas aeruginosa]MCT1318819.1 hypothetical protein [Pseudomonas aeruginosa]